MITLLSEIIILTWSTTWICSSWLWWGQYISNKDMAIGYHMDKPQIIVCKDNDYDIVMSHELIWHHIWTTRLTQKEKDLWGILHNMKGYWWEFVSEYAKTNIEEDFAETMSYAYRNIQPLWWKIMGQKLKFARIIISKYNLTK